MSGSDTLLLGDDIGVSGRRDLGFLLIDGFSLISYAAVVEPFRAANLLSERALYGWRHFAVSGRSARASNGAVIQTDGSIGDCARCDTLFIFAGGEPRELAGKRTFAELRRLAARGTVVAGISAGPYLMAQAGLLKGYRATIHWLHRAAFVEAFPTHRLEAKLFVIDRRRISCAGGLAGFHLALKMIEIEHGAALAADISDWFIQPEQRSADKPQRRSLHEKYGVSNDRVLRVLAHMEASIENPASREQLAGLAEVSPRQLERLFEKHLGRRIRETYTSIRLERARSLLRTTGLEITDVAVACGFPSSSHFSRCYKQVYGIAPSQDRRAPSAR